jgi:predicted DNA-binding transcriptional regulator YafY
LNTTLGVVFNLENKRTKAEGGENMQSAIDRRQQVLEAISDRRQEQIENLATEFGVSRRTIERDILVLSCSYPIITVQGGAGGVRAADGWYLSRRYLHDDQEALLRSLLPGLQPEQAKTMEAILTAFAKPKTKENKN